MTKFLRLVGNEWKKQFRRAMAWILIGIVFLSAVGNVLLEKMLNSYFIDYSSQEEWRSQVDYFEEQVKGLDEKDQLEDWEIENQKSLAFYRYLLDHRIEWSDWRYSTGLIYEMISAEYTEGEEEQYRMLSEIVESNDLKRYYRYCIDSLPDDSGYRDATLWQYTYCMEHDIIPNSTDWRYELTEGVCDAKTTIAEQTKLKEANSATYNEKKVAEAENKIAILLYRLDHDVKVNPADCLDGDSGCEGFWAPVADSVSLMSLIGLATIIIGGSIVAEEFSAGTIKFLLVNPVKRWKILLSKYVTLLSIGFSLVGAVFILSILSSGIFNGFSDVLLPYITAEGGSVVLKSPILILLGKYLLASIRFVVMSTLAFAISSLARNAALAIGISMAMYFTGSLITALLIGFNLDFGRYLIFANLDFPAILNHESGFIDHSLPVAILVVVLHMIVFLWTAWDGFVRREV